MTQVKTLSLFLLLAGIFPLFARGFDARTVFRLVFYLLVPAYFAVFWTQSLGLTFINRALISTPLFSRPFLDGTIKKLLAEASYKNCSGPVWATLAKFSSYQDPFAIDWRFKPESRFADKHWENKLPSDWRLNDQPEIVEWTPYYVDIRKERFFYVDFRKEKEDSSWVLEASSAIPYAFKAVIKKDNALSDRRETFVDGGLCDNCPIAPVVQSKPGIIIVIDVNNKPSILTDVCECIFGVVRNADRIQKNWLKFVFSNREMEDEVDRIRAEWVRESTKFQGPDNISGLPADPPSIGVDPGYVKFLWISPSVKTASSLPIVGMLKGTMNFTQEYVDRLAKLGYEDTRRILNSLEEAGA